MHNWFVNFAVGQIATRSQIPKEQSIFACLKETGHANSTGDAVFTDTKAWFQFSNDQRFSL
jgi:hypothetical protein